LAATLDKILSGFDHQPAELIPALQAIQNRFGYLSKEALRRVAQHCGLPESTAFGVASFYEQFYLSRQGKHKVKVCQGTGCHVRGSAQVMEAIEGKLGIKPGETTPDYRFTLEQVACFGACALSPIVMINGKVYGKVTASKALKLIGKLA